MVAHDSRKGERFAQVHTAGQDVDMPDVPPREPPDLPRRPRVLEYRHGSGETTPSVHRNDSKARPVMTYDHIHTSYTTYEATGVLQPASTRPEPQASRVLAKGTPERSARDLEDDENEQSLRHEENLRRDAEDKLAALQDSYQLLKLDLQSEIDRRTKVEQCISDSNARSAVHMQNTIQTQSPCDDGLPDKEVDLTSVRGQLELKEKQLNDERAQWISEKQQHESERQQWVSERQKWESKENQYVADVKDFKSRWKKAAKELDGLRVQGQGFYQVTDNYLCDLIIQLRYKIRDFGIQYFSEELSKCPRFEPNRVWKDYMVSTTRDRSYLDLVECSETRPSVIQAFLWRVIVQEVFCKFRWAGSASSPVTKLSKDLESCLQGGGTAPANADTTKKLHTWRATTVNLVLDTMGQQKRRQADNELQRWEGKLYDEVYRNLRLLKPKGQKGCQQDFLDIINEAVKIDREISKQVSRVTWTFGSEDVIQTLDLASMELRKGEVFKPKSKVTLVTSPGVIKQGKSTGEGFESNFDLLKMEVSCETAASWQ